MVDGVSCGGPFRGEVEEELIGWIVRGGEIEVGVRI